jgi:hypothetical protein
LEEMLRPTITPLLEELQRTALMREAIFENSIAERVGRELGVWSRGVVVHL